MLKSMMANLEHENNELNTMGRLQPNLSDIVSRGKRKTAKLKNENANDKEQNDCRGNNFFFLVS